MGRWITDVALEDLDTCLKSWETKAFSAQEFDLTKTSLAITQFLSSMSVGIDHMKIKVVYINEGTDIRLNYDQRLYADRAINQFVKVFDDLMASNVQADAVRQIYKRIVAYERRTRNLAQFMDVRPRAGMYSCGKLYGYVAAIKHLETCFKRAGKSIWKNYSCEKWAGMLENVFESCFSFYLATNNNADAIKTCYIFPRPKQVWYDEFGRVTCPNSFTPAIDRFDGSSTWAYKGVEVPRKDIEHPESITIRRIQSEDNVEVRRALTEIYGLDRYVMDSGATVRDDDHRFGTLYFKRHTEWGEDDICMVKVVNSSPEPDGTYKIVFLRVPPYMRTAKAAVAWTFNMEPEAYDPQLES